MPILSLKHKGLQKFFESGSGKLIRGDIRDKCRQKLDYLNEIADPSDCRVFGHFHTLTGDRQGQYALRISANYRMTFRWDGRNVYDVDLEDDYRT
ncbi:MAG: hypothetical protein EXQ92_13695 [Alphaproteobacteria bacterium]|nr:hypothetical protein [Alphaproteobacteria bacterium]